MGEWFRAGPHPSGWDFEHVHRDSGTWGVIGRPPHGDTLSMDYEKTPHGQIEFNKADHDYNKKTSPAGNALLRQHTLDFHNATEHVPEPAKTQRRVYYHGTSVSGVSHILPASQRGGEVHYDETDPRYAYATTSLEDAWHHAGNVSTPQARPRVYQVRPIGGHQHVEKDPDHYEDGSYRDGVMEGDHRSAKGFQVVREMKAPHHIRKAYPEYESWDG
jgi:hypothetical protein